MTGTGRLLRLALRLDRVRLPIWILLIGLTPALTASNYQHVYPTQHALDEVAPVLSTPSLQAIAGPLFAVSIGGLTAWKVGTTELLIVALMALLTVVRHTRTDEETGRSELLGATVVGRSAQLSAAVLTAAVGSVGAGLLLTLGLLGTGLAAAGALAFGLTVAAFGVLFAAVAAITAQLSTSGRTASGIAFAVLGASFVLRAAGDTGPTALSWISPMGWAMRVRPFASERWWLLLPLLALAVGCLGVASTLNHRRDLGAGLLTERPGPAAAAPSLRSPWALAWRLHRGPLLAWSVGLLVAGAVLGGAAKGLSGSFDDNPSLQDMLARLGGSRQLTDAYLGAVFGLIGLTAAAYTVQATARLRAEETAGRVEPLLATRTSRAAWMAGHLLFGLLGTALLLALAGVGAGLAYGVQIHDVGGQVGRMLGDLLVQLPAAWVLAGLGAALFGLVPRLAAWNWALFGAFALLFEVGAIVGFNQRIVDISPFAHTPKLPGGEFSATPLIWLTVIAVVLIGGGVAGFRRRDLG
jgi:ABC-2 type transport system permease protein